MEELLKEVFKQYGLVGAILAVMVWDKFLRRRWKTSIHERVAYLEKWREEHIKKNDAFMEREAMEDIKIERMHTNLGNLETQVARENGHIFKQLESIHAAIADLNRFLREGKI